MELFLIFSLSHTGIYGKRKRENNKSVFKLEA